MSAAAVAANPGEPAFEEPVSISYGKFTFTRKGWTAIISADGREVQLPAHLFLRTTWRVLSHNLGLGILMYYGGFAVHNLGDPIEGDKVKLYFLGEPKVEQTFDKEEVRAKLKEIYDTLRWPKYEEWY